MDRSDRAIWSELRDDMGDRVQVIAVSGKPDLILALTENGGKIGTAYLTRSQARKLIEDLAYAVGLLS